MTTGEEYIDGFVAADAVKAVADRGVSCVCRCVMTQACDVAAFDCPAADSLAAVRVYGEASTLQPPCDVAVPLAEPFGGVGYRLFALAALVLYLFVALHYGRRLWPRVAGRRSRRRSAEHADGDLSADALAALYASGCATVGIAAVRADVIAGTGIAGMFGGEAGLAAAAGVAAWAVLCLQWGIIRLAGRITFCDSFSEALSARRGDAFTAFALFAAPPVLAAAVLPAGAVSGVCMVLFAIVSAACVMAQCLSSFLLFREQKVSILFWILYLCTVEAVPAGAVFTALLRSVPA